MTLAAPAELPQTGIRPALPGLALPSGLGLPALVLLCELAASLKAEGRSLLDLLDDHDDVQDVFANFDIPTEVLESLD